MVQTVRGKYVYLDIVGFTRGRSVEAQSDLIAILNKAVRAAVSVIVGSAASVIYLPTGDGIAVALLNVDDYDVHVRLGLAILSEVHEHNRGCSDDQRRFGIRIGVNENLDNLVSDVNDSMNVAGAGISMAQRVMDKADAGQLLIGDTVHEVLRHRERYMSSFRSYRAVAKHNTHFGVHQYVGPITPGLNVDPPASFASQPAEVKLSREVAYYFALAAKNRSTLVECVRSSGGSEYAATLLLYLLAKDWAAMDAATEIDVPRSRTWGFPTTTFGQQLAHYASMDITVLGELEAFIRDTVLSPFTPWLEGRFWQSPIFVNEAGVTKIKKEWPTIAQRFEL